MSFIVIDWNYLQLGYEVRDGGTKRYNDLAKRRDNLMKLYSSGDISRGSYLKRMGSVSLKSDNESGRMVFQADRQQLLQLQQTIVEEDSDDDLSETRPPVVSDCDSDTEQEDPFPQRVPKRRAFIAPLLQARKKAQKCLICGKGFQLKRKLHIVCALCPSHVHKRCIPKDKQDSFLCSKCSAPSSSAAATSATTRDSSTGQSFQYCSIFIILLSFNFELFHISGFPSPSPEPKNLFKPVFKDIKFLSIC